MAFNKDQFRGLIIDVLREADLYSPASVELLMLTCAVESNFGTYIEQITGPALGVFQMEPATYEWLTSKYPWASGESAEDLRFNLRTAILLARLRYRVVPEPLPNATNVEALARYWKKYYNTELGKGTIEEAVNKYKEYCV